MLAVANCGAYGQPPLCPQDVELSSPCGIVNVTTTCAGAGTSSCGSGTCSVGPIVSSCSISVVLGDGTTQTIAVTVGQSPDGRCASSVVVSPRDGFQSFSSATCHAPFGPEAGVDASNDGDASSDADAPTGD